MTEQELNDFNNIGKLMVNMFKKTFDHWNIKLKDNIKDLYIGIDDRELIDEDYLKDRYGWYVWIEVKEGPHESKEYGASIDILKSDFGKTKFKTVEEVRQVITDAIKDYLYGTGTNNS